jgi:hypothetical protein
MPPAAIAEIEKPGATNVFHVDSPDKSDLLAKVTPIYSAPALRGSIIKRHHHLHRLARTTTCLLHLSLAIFASLGEVEPSLNILPC